MPKVLIITYYWPPAGGGGVQRWLKFVKYLPEFGITPVIYTPEDPDYPVTDESLLQEVHPDLEIWRHPIWEPYDYYRRFMGMKKHKKIYSGFIGEHERETFRQKVSVFIRGNFFIPDARKFWIDPSVNHLVERLTGDPVDLIVSTGPPHSMHRIALGVSQALNIPWIADFRDPWTGIDFYDKLRLMPWADRKHRNLEKEVLQAADAVVTVSPQWKADLEVISKRPVHVMTNGYDETDFKGEVPLTPEFTLTHLGSVNPDRNAPLLWKTLESLISTRQDFARQFRLRLVGPVDESVLAGIREYPGLIKALSLREWVDHTEAVRMMQESQVLLLLLNNTPNKFGIVPGKLFEYLGAQRPVLCIGPAGGDADMVLRDCNAGQVTDYGDGAEMTRIMNAFCDQFTEGGIPHLPEDQITKFARRNIVRAYASLMKETSQRASPAEEHHHLKKNNT